MGADKELHPVQAASKRIIAKVGGDTETRLNDLAAGAADLYRTLIFFVFKMAVTGGRMNAEDVTMGLMIIKKTCKSTFDLMVEELEKLNVLKNDNAPATIPQPTLYDLNGHPLRPS